METPRITPEVQQWATDAIGHAPINSGIGLRSAAFNHTTVNAYLTFDNKLNTWTIWAHNLCAGSTWRHDGTATILHTYNINDQNPNQ